MQLLSIQYLRAIAVLLVVYCHAIDFQMKIGVSRQQNFYYLQNFGAIGVDIFFVISGFIIVFIAQNAAGSESAIYFLKKRFVRIIPSYYFASFIVLIIAILTNQHVYWAVIKTITILPIFDRGTEFWSALLFVGWTLSFECFFYIIYATLIYFSISRKTIFLIMIFGMLTLVGVLFRINEAHFNFYTNPLVWEFCFGVIIALIYKTAKVKSSFAFLILTLGIVGFLINLFSGYGRVSEATDILAGKYCWQRVFYWGVPSALLAFGALFIEKSSANGIFKNGMLTLLGNGSFSIYLVHPIFFMILELSVKKQNAWQQINPDLLVIILTIIASLLGIAYYKTVELFLIKKFNKIILK